MASDQPHPSPHGGDCPPLQHLRHLIREQLASAVTDDQLDSDRANGMLAQFGLPPLHRHWQVRLSVPVTVEVTATDVGDAEAAATELLEEMPWPDRTGIRADLIEVDDIQAGAIDTGNP